MVRGKDYDKGNYQQPVQKGNSQSTITGQDT